MHVSKHSIWSFFLRLRGLRGRINRALLFFIACLCCFFGSACKALHHDARWLMPSHALYCRRTSAYTWIYLCLVASRCKDDPYVSSLTPSQALHTHIVTTLNAAQFFNRRFRNFWDEPRAHDSHEWLLSRGMALRACVFLLSSVVYSLR